MNILIFFIILFVLVLSHEAGHFFTAKFFRIRVDEFGFGFPPKLFGVKKGETEYSFNLLPLGGFVKIFGEDPNEESLRGPDASRSFVNKSKTQQAIVLFAGVFANFILAWLLFSFGFMSGLPMSVGTQPDNFILKDVNLVIVSVAEDSPAQVVGLKPQDKIIYVKSGYDFVSNITPEILQEFVVNHQEQILDIGYVRGDTDKIEGLQNINYSNYLNFKEIKSASVKPSIYDNSSDRPTIGISMDEIGFAKLSFFPALWEGMKINLNVTKATLVGLYELVSNSINGKGSLTSITGPVGMVGIVGDAYQFGFAYLLSFAALISVNLAIINLVPFPALDGGRLLFLFIEKIKGSRINPKIVNTLNIVGFTILIILMLLVTYHDIVNLI